MQEKHKDKEKMHPEKHEEKLQEKVAEKPAKQTDPHEQWKAKEKDYIDTLQRLQAEFENYRKRMEKERDRAFKFGCNSMMTEILPVLDSFELAIKNKDKQEDFVKGMELVYAQLRGGLEKSGLKIIEALGKPFDANRHEAMLAQDVNDEKDDGKILEEFQRGYMVGEFVLRHSRVKVGKFKPQEAKK